VKIGGERENASRMEMPGLGMVAQTRNPSHLGSEGRRIMVQDRSGKVNETITLKQARHGDIHL
jgi:hypothetical protein